LRKNYKPTSACYSSLYVFQIIAKRLSAMDPVVTATAPNLADQIINNIVPNGIQFKYWK